MDDVNLWNTIQCIYSFLLTISTWYQNYFRRQLRDSIFLFHVDFGIWSRCAGCWEVLQLFEWLWAHFPNLHRKPTGPSREPWCFESICRVPRTPHRFNYPSFAPHYPRSGGHWSWKGPSVPIPALPRVGPRALRGRRFAPAGEAPGRERLPGPSPPAEPRCPSPAGAVGAAAGGPRAAVPPAPRSHWPQAPPLPGPAARAYSGGTALPLAPGAAGSRRDARPAELSALGAAGPGAARAGAARRAPGAAAARPGSRRCRAGAWGRCALGGAGAEHGAALLRRGRALPLCECGAAFGWRRVGTLLGTARGALGGARWCLWVPCGLCEPRGQRSVQRAWLFQLCSIGHRGRVNSLLTLWPVQILRGAEPPWETMQQIVGAVKKMPSISRSECHPPGVFCIHGTQTVFSSETSSLWSVLSISACQSHETETGCLTSSLACPRLAPLSTGRAFCPLVSWALLGVHCFKSPSGRGSLFP